MVTCPTCGKENQDHYKFCLGCGLHLVGLPRQESRPPAFFDVGIKDIACGIPEQIAWEPGGTRLAILSGSREGIGRRIMGRLSIDGGVTTPPDVDYVSFAWSPSGGQIVAATDAYIRLLNADSLQPAMTIDRASATRLAWSPSGAVLASVDRHVPLTTTVLRVIGKGSIPFANLASTTAKDGVGNAILEWSPDGKCLATMSEGQLAVVFPNEPARQLTMPSLHEVSDFAWSPDSKTAVVAGGSTLSIWDVPSGRETDRLEVHDGDVQGLAFSPDGKWLALRCISSWRLLRANSWIPVARFAVDVAELEKSMARRPCSRKFLAFASDNRSVAINGPLTGVLVYTLDERSIARSTSRAAPKPPASYANAKVVLLGDSGVGKSGLGLVLSGQEFVPTESTHGRRVWQLETSEETVGNGRKEVREVLLWDLAGQPGYRLVHQLHLDEVSVALIVFDAKSEIEPLSGVRHWARALAQAERLRAPGGPRTAIWLVAARVDRGGLNVSRERIDTLVRELDFRGYIETSAKEGLNVTELREAIRQSIPWDQLPRLHSTDLFQALRGFVLREKEKGHVLSNTNDLLARFTNDEFAAKKGEHVLRESVAATDRDATDLRRAFLDTVDRLASSGLVRRLNFGNLILLQPELLDAYASAMVNAARAEPDGLGSLYEEAALTGRFSIPKDERLRDEQDERLLLIATVEDLIRHEIALKEQADDGPHLVFPSQLTREVPAAAETADRAVVLQFEGAIVNVYATLVVRLSYSGRFKKGQMWRNGITFEAVPCGSCSLMLRESEEGAGELAISYGEGASAETCDQFERYVTAHLERRAVRGTIRRRAIFRCPGCKTPVSEVQAQRRKERGHLSMTCPVCDGVISLVDAAQGPTPDASIVATMDRRADSTRDSNAASLVLSGKRNVGEFDVFLCHTSADKPSVRRIAELLEEREILPWLDEAELRPGLPWQRTLEEQIDRIRCAAVFVGPSGLGPWQQQELDAFLRQFVRRGCPVIPVLLEDAPAQPKLPVFLEAMTWVDFRRVDPNPLDRLIWGITGERAATSRA